MAGSVVQDSSSRSKWAEGMGIEVVLSRRKYLGRPGSIRLRSSSQLIRLLKDSHEVGISRTYSFRENRGRAAPDTRKDLLNGSTLKEAVASLVKCVDQGVALNPDSCVDVLQRCLKLKEIESVQQVHDCIRKCGLEGNTYVANNLLMCYIGCGRLEKAEEFFNKFSNRSIVSWNTMIGGYVDNDQAEHAVEVYKQLRSEGWHPSAVTYLTVLKTCGSPKALNWGRDIHGHILLDGLQQDIRVSTALVSMYAKCGSIEDARAVFGGMGRRNVISWNAMIGALALHGLGHEAFSLFLQMEREGFVPDEATYLSILSPCSSAGALEWVRKVHSHATNAGLDVALRVRSALIHMYSKCGSIEDAKLVFGLTKDRDVVNWTVMIGGLAEHGLGHEAFSLFLQMEKEGFVPGAVTYLSILNPSSSAGALEWVKIVHAHATKSRLDVDLRVSNALIHMYAKSGSIEDARVVFDKMEERDIISWNVMIGGLAEHGLGHEAFSLFLQMEKEELLPDDATYLSLLNFCSSAVALEWVKKVHAHATKAGFDLDLRVKNTLIHEYAKNGSIEDAKVVFGRMEKRDLVSWNVMIGGLAEHGLGHEAFSLFLQMEKEGLVPDVATYMSILNPNSSAGALEWVKKVHAHARKAGLDVDVRVGNTFVHMYAKVGSIADARQVFDKMPDRDVISWTVMILGLGEHGLGRVGLELLDEMNDEGVRPSGSLFVAVLSACSHAGLVDEGRLQFKSMVQDYGIKPGLEHYTCMVDVLGRAGHLDEAKLFLLTLPIKPSEVTWTALLGASRIYHNIKLAGLAAEACLKLEPKSPATYVLLSNIYASVGNWDQVFVIRNMMQERNMRKVPGECWIEVDSKVHYFRAGDTYHPQTREIYATLNSLSEEMKAEGYIPDTRLVLRNVDEEDKYSLLCSHSERLAIAYGLMYLTPGKPIRIYKNLRICTDCHVATKLISKITGREIVARDVHRFHYFKDGACSCGDYW